MTEKKTDDTKKDETSARRKRKYRQDQPSPIDQLTWGVVCAVCCDGQKRYGMPIDPDREQ